MPKRRPPSRNPVLERIIGLGIIGLVIAVVLFVLDYFGIVGIMDK